MTESFEELMKELLTDTNLSHHRIVSKIGAGGMGEVYLAEDENLTVKSRSRFCLRNLPQIKTG
jgi:serine/threonine protein kinase